MTLLSLPSELVQRCLLLLPLSSLASCTLACRQLARLVIGKQNIQPLWQVRLREERVDGMLGCRLAYAARSVRRASSVAFGEFWSSLKAQVETFPGFAEGTVSSTIELPLDDSRRMVSMEGRVMNAVGYVYNRHLNKMIACPRAGDLPGEQEALVLTFLDVLYEVCIMGRLGASVGYIVLTPCAARALSSAVEWYFALLHIACTVAALPLDAICRAESSTSHSLAERRALNAAIRELLFKKPESWSHDALRNIDCVRKVQLSEQDLTDANGMSIGPSQVPRLLLRPFLEDVAVQYCNTALDRIRDFGGADDDPGMWESGCPPDYTADVDNDDDSDEENFGGGGYGVRYVARETRRVGPVPQVLITAADLTKVLQSPLLWPAQAGFARSVTAEIIAELNGARTELCELSRGQFGYTTLDSVPATLAPVVQRYIFDLHSSSAVFERLPERRRTGEESPETDSSEAEFTDDDETGSDSDDEDDESWGEQDTDSDGSDDAL